MTMALYDDEFVTLTEYNVVIKNYHFPSRYENAYFTLNYARK